MKTIATVSALAVLAVCGCTSLKVQPLRTESPISSVLIRENPKVAVSDFLDVLVDGFQRHGINTRVVRADIPVSKNAYLVDYVARRSWDMAPYLVDASITITRDGLRVAHAEYHLRGGGGLSPLKWQGTRKKIAPMIDELLATAHPGGSGTVVQAGTRYDGREHLRAIKQLYEEGLITKDQYDARVKDVLKDVEGD